MLVVLCAVSVMRNSRYFLSDIKVAISLYSFDKPGARFILLQNDLSYSSQIRRCHSSMVAGISGNNISNIYCTLF